MELFAIQRFLKVQLVPAAFRHAVVGLALGCLVIGCGRSPKSADAKPTPSPQNHVDPSATAQPALKLAQPDPVLMEDPHNVEPESAATPDQIANPDAKSQEMTAEDTALLPPVVEEAPTPAPSAPPQNHAVSDLIGKIRALNEEIRMAREAAAITPPTAEEVARIEKLKKRRDKLSEDLTKLGKP